MFLTFLTEIHMQRPTPYRHFQYFCYNYDMAACFQAFKTGSIHISKSSAVIHFDISELKIQFKIFSSIRTIIIEREK